MRRNTASAIPLAAAAVLGALLNAPSAHAAGVWVFEAEFDRWLSSATVAAPWCQRVTIADPVVLDPRASGGTHPCGSGSIVYMHWLGRSCFNDRDRLRRLEFECGWRHRSAPNVSNEIFLDAVGIKLRFTFGRERP